MTAVMVTSLPPGFDSEQCKLLFGNFGKIAQCVVSPSNVPGEEGFFMALMLFENPQEAEFTVSTLNGQQVMGFPAPLRVQLMAPGGQAMVPAGGQAMVPFGGEASSSYGPMAMGKGGAKPAGPYGPPAGKGKGKSGGVNPKATNMMNLTPEQIAEAMKVGMSRAKPGSYKTMMCKNFEQHGTCASGFECTWAHSVEELQAGIAAIDPSNIKGYKMKLCQFWQETGTCHKGAACKWAHGIQDMRAPPNVQQPVDAQSLQAAAAAQQAQLMSSPQAQMAAQQQAQMAAMGAMGAMGGIPGMPGMGATMGMPAMGSMGGMAIIDPMALQAQNYMAGLLPAADDGVARPGEVRYSNAEDANKAVKKLQGQILHGWPMEIRPDPMSQDGTKLIVENLAPTVTWQALKDVFKTIGRVEYAGREGSK
eukprot:gnl/TRDRNA2_/TRDRNA2_176173_c0_seq34.p1 gnl/TRDRNA2_/TRDRNA2_176173_c0~~gnl/TRDRNA2_/TRDRNA2_176173_c0_seq34.p1  ORF type:complete len:420 (+),score=69.98 gnl/TRDRNA2_/TRDRNA2_176173_c0_seq34:61-1320(+)